MLITIYNTCYMDRWIDKYIGIYWYILSLDILVLLSWNDNENSTDLLENLIHTIWEIFAF